MKRFVMATIILAGISSAASAQTSGSNSSNSTSVSSSTATKSSTKGGKKAGAKKAVTDSTNNRKMYNYKDGQRATPTGHEATGTNGGYAALGKDSTTAPRDSTKQ